MRRIAEQHRLIDADGFAWEADITVPWGEATDSHGPATPQVTLHPPDNPEHWAYGEADIIFDLAYLETVVVLAELVD